MSFRTRLFLAILVAVLLPLAALTLGVRREMDRRLTREYEARVTAAASALEASLARESANVAARLRALVSELGGDNRFRLAIVQNDPASRHYLLNYAEGAMRLSGLALLQLQDSTGRILSSGHFRNQFDQLQPELPRILSGLADSLVLVRTRTPDTTLLALTRIDSVRLAGRRVSLVGGIEARRWLQATPQLGGDIATGIVYPGAPPQPAAAERVIREVQLPFLDLLHPAVRIDTARLQVTQTLETVNALRRDVTRWVLVALALTLAAAVLCAAWLSSRISRPLRELSEKTAAIDLDRLDQSFETGRTDEFGALSRLLGAMTDRLRASSARLREAERRVAVGDLARQVNHDIKNGLVPIRNVLRHLAQVATESPDSLPGIFAARRATLESSVEYLDTLARNYDRLSPGAERRHCEINGIVAEVLRNTGPQDGRVRAQLADALPSVLGDGLMIRRVLENLVGNALDSVAARPEGSVTVVTEPVAGSTGADRIRITVADTGAGMTGEQLERAFDDFYTTKTGGTGLGLSIVRRLILDLNGTLKVETEPGVGTRVMVELPVAQQEAAG
ncbi:MAG TPA: HAMP domain-containing sensor histidine kinase [Gemmatimonadales bacterium]|nr:HAMP domain-containing sensor histidine kinase [Gemmatimonadales bacterium]